MHHDQLDAFLFSHPNPSNKTGEDLQDLIEGIPYPTEDLSLTSFESSENTPSRPHPQPIPSKKRFYTQAASDEKSQKSDKPLNLNNFNNSSTPHRVSLIKDWSKLHVTPGDSKNIFPQVIAPSIEFSQENLNSNKKSNNQISPNPPSSPIGSEEKEFNPRSSYFESNISKKLETMKNEDKERRVKSPFQTNLTKKIENSTNFKNSQNSEAILCSDQTQDEILRLRAENDTLSNQLVLQRKLIAKQEKETEFLAKRINELEEQHKDPENNLEDSNRSIEIEKQKLLCQGYRTRVGELEKLIRNEEELRKEKEEELKNREEELFYIRKENQTFSEKLKEMKEIVENLEEECRRKEKKLMEMKEPQELFFLEENSKGKGIHKENSELANEFTTLRQNYDQIIARKDIEIAEMKLILQQKNSPIKEEPSFGRGSASCDHKSLLLNFFKDIDFKGEEQEGGLEGKNYPDLMEILYSVFGNMQEQFEQIYNERNDYDGKLREMEEKYGEWEKIEGAIREFEREKEEYEEYVNEKNREIENKMKNLERKFGELALKERENANSSFRRTVQNEVDLRNLEEYQLKLKTLRENQGKLELQQEELKNAENSLLKLREELNWKDKELNEKNRIMDENIEEYKRKIACMKKSQTEFDEKSENELKILKQEYKQLQEEIEKLQKYNSELTFQLKNAEADSRQNQVISFANENALNKENETLKNERSKLKNEVENLQAKLAEFTNIKSQNEDLIQSLRTEKTLKAAFEEEIKTFKLRESELDQHLKEKDRKNIELFKEIRTLTENNRILEENLNSQKLENDKKSKLLKEKAQDYKSLVASQKTNVELQLNNKNLTEKIEECQSKISILSNKNDELQSKIGFLSAKNEELLLKSERSDSNSLLKVKLTELESEIPKFLRNLSAIQSKLNTLQKTKENLENLLTIQADELSKRSKETYEYREIVEKFSKNPSLFDQLLHLEAMGVLEKLLNESFWEKFFNEKILERILNENALDRSSTEAETATKNLNLVMEWLDGLEMLSGTETMEVLEELLRKIGGSKMMRRLVQDREVIRYMMQEIVEGYE